MRLIAAPIAACLVAAAGPAWADPPCGAVEFRFQPGAWNLQIVLWVEDAQGNVVATPYITRATGQFGIANRPGAALLKTDCGWPYGRREMVAPVWAHRRNHRYPKVVMGGACGNSPSSTCQSGTCGGNCDDTTIAYHGLVSSPEPYFCAPAGCVGGAQPDVVSCATPVRTLSKGAYADPTMSAVWSLYPPRADVTRVDPHIDSPDLRDFPARNDLVAVSQATPRPGQPLDAPVYWNPQGLAPGDYVAWVEVSQESDFNDAHNHPNLDDSIEVWNGQGHPFLGQPSVVYRVPFHYDAAGGTASTDAYAGYGAWDGQDGALRPPDGTITVGQDGHGEGRLVTMGDGHRVTVLVASATGNTAPPGAPTALAAAPEASGTGVTVTFRAPAGSTQAERFAVRYRVGSDPITDASFDAQLVGPTVVAKAAGDTVTATLSGLMAGTDYQVAVRGVSGCTVSPIATTAVKTAAQKFTTLNGCFVATAAWGSPLEREVAGLRAFRDKRLYGNPAGELFVAGYYAFGPSLAAAVAEDPGRRALARRALTPVARVLADLR